MKVSLITVCFNSESTIATAMESVLRQKNVDLEYWVIDGGSRDRTVDLIRSYGLRSQGKMHWISEKDRGMYDAINKGIQRSTGDVIGILNADDFLETDTILSEVAETFTKNPETQAVYADIRFVHEEENHPTDAGQRLEAIRNGETIRYYSAKQWRPWMLQWGFMPPHPSVYIRREWFSKIGGYKLGYKIAADYELLIRFLRRNKLKTCYLEKSFVGMRTGGLSTRGWRSNLLLNQEIARGNRENGYFCSLPMLVPKYIFKIWEFILPEISGRKKKV